MKIKNFLLNKKVSVIWVIFIPLMSMVLLSSFMMNRGFLPVSTEVATKPSVTVADCPVNMDQIRENKSAFVKPLLLTDVLIQDRSMSSLKSQLENYISQKISSNTFQIASIYVRKLDNGSYISINGNELYNPASLMKVAYLITYLKEAETKPSLLQKKIFFDKHFQEGNNQNIVSFSLKEKHNYTISDLLQAMIVYSDNDATALLQQNINSTIFKKLFVDLQLPAPPLQGEYFIGASDYAKFLRVLYSSTYLDAAFSEFAISLMLRSTFNEGICSTLDPSIPVAHKFGERVLNNVAQLHEFGIVYYNNSPYLIGVMVKGNSLAPLKQSLGEISGIVFKYMQSPS